jgi:hypothetical protein
VACAVKPTYGAPSDDAAEALKPADRRFVDALRALSSGISSAADAVNEFARILRERDVAAFVTWQPSTAG